MPGKIIQAMKKADTGNPVFLLDEVDKMSMDFRGDPSALFLKFWIPSRTSTSETTTSKSTTICASHVLHDGQLSAHIPRPLLDRMEIISLEGYTEEEKFHIARKLFGAASFGSERLEGPQSRRCKTAHQSDDSRLYQRSRRANLERELQQHLPESARVKVLSATRS